MKKLIVIIIGCFLSIQGFSQTVPFQIEHRNKKEINNSDWLNYLEKIKVFYFSGDYKQLNEVTEKLLSALIDNHENHTFNIYITNQSLGTIKNGISYFYGRGIDNPYQSNIYDLETKENNFYEVAFFSNDEQLLTTYTFVKSDSDFPNQVASYAETVLPVIAPGVERMFFPKSGEYEFNIPRQDSIIVDSMEAINKRTGISGLDQIRYLQSKMEDDSLKALFDTENISLLRDFFVREGVYVVAMNSYNNKFDFHLGGKEEEDKKIYVSVNPFPFPPNKKKELDESTVVVQRLLKESPDDKKPFKSEFTYQISGKKIVSFSVMTGVLFSYTNKAKDVLADGMIQSKSIDGAMTMGVINFHLTKYSPKKEYKLFDYSNVVGFGGIILTPEFGFGIGLGLRIHDRIFLNFGRAYMFVDEVKSNIDLNQSYTSSDGLFNLKKREAFFSGLAIKF